MKKPIAGAAAALLLAGGIVALSGTAASAHTPEASATCDALTIEATYYETRPASGDPEIQIPNPDYVPATPGTPAVGTPTIVVENPDYVPAQPAVYEEQVTEREYKKWKIWWWDVQWFPANANPGGWTPTGNVRTEQVLVTPEQPAQGTPTIEVANPDYVPATPPTEAQGEPTITAPNPDYVAADDAPNTVTATVDGEQVLSESFGTDYSTTVPLEKYTEHDWSVTITAWNDADGSKGWTKTITGTTTACEKPAQPEPIVTTGEWVTGDYACGDETVTETREVTTTEHTWNGSEWVPGEPVTTTEERTRDLTAEEIDALECEVVTPPTEEPEEPTTEPKPAAPEEPKSAAPAPTVAKAAATEAQADTLAQTGGADMTAWLLGALGMIAAGAAATVIRRKRA